MARVLLGGVLFTAKKRLKEMGLSRALRTQLKLKTTPTAAISRSPSPIHGKESERAGSGAGSDGPYKTSSVMTEKGLRKCIARHEEGVSRLKT